MKCPIPSRMARWSLPALGLLLLVGCSRTELFYNNADWLAYRWTVGLVDASDAQREAWRGAFERLLAEHRRELLPEVIVLLRGLEDAADSGLRRERLACRLDAVDHSYRRHARLVVPVGVEVLAELDAAQVDGLERELAERNAEYREAYLDPDPQRRRQARLERYVERIERWTGDLDARQLRLVEVAVDRLPDVAADWLAYREARQAQLLGVLRAADPGRAAEVRTLLVEWWVTFDHRPTALVAGTDALRQGFLDLVVALDQTLSRRQRDHFVAELRNLREGLQAALEQADAPVAAADPALACTAQSQASL